MYEKQMLGITCRDSSVLENCYIDDMKRDWMM